MNPRWKFPLRYLLPALWLVALVVAAGPQPTPPLLAAEPTPAAQAALAGAPHALFYTYDAAGRLTMVDYGGIGIVYVYDAAGNLLEIKRQPRIYLPLVLRNR